MKLGLDPNLPKVPVLLKGRTYHLCFDFNAICMAEVETGINLLSAAQFEKNALNLRAMFWASLLHENPEMTLEQAGTLMSNFRDLGDVNMLILQAWSGSLPDPDEDETPGEATGQVPA